MVGIVKLRIDVPRTLYSGEMMNGSCVAKVNRIPIRTIERFLRVRVQSEMCLVQQTSKAISVAPSYYQINFTVICINGSHYIQCFLSNSQAKLMITGICS